MGRPGKKHISSLSYERLHHDTPSNKVEGYPIMFLPRYFLFISFLDFLSNAVFFSASRL